MSLCFDKREYTLIYKLRKRKLKSLFFLRGLNWEHSYICRVSKGCSQGLRLYP